MPQQSQWWKVTLVPQNPTWEQHDPRHEKQQDAVYGHTLLQYDDEDLGVHQGGVQETAPHEQQAAQEVAKVAEANTLAEEDAVVVPPQHTNIAVVAVGAPRWSVRLTDVAVPGQKKKDLGLRSGMKHRGVSHRQWFTLSVALQENYLSNLKKVCTSQLHTQ